MIGHDKKTVVALSLITALSLTACSGVAGFGRNEETTEQISVQQRDLRCMCWPTHFL